MQCKLIADIALFTDDEVLLVKYRQPPDGTSGWFLPDDMLQEFEHPGDAVTRITSEQIGLSIHPELDFIESFKGHDGTWHLVFHYRAEVDRGSITTAPAITETRWFKLDDLPARSEVAHGGWALATLNQMLAARRDHSR